MVLADGGQDAEILGPCRFICDSIKALGQHRQVTRHSYLRRSDNNVAGSVWSKAKLNEEGYLVQGVRNSKYYCGLQNFDGQHCTYGHDRKSIVARHMNKVVHLQSLEASGTLCSVCGVQFDSTQDALFHLAASAHCGTGRGVRRVLVPTASSATPDSLSVFTPSPSSSLPSKSAQPSPHDLVLGLPRCPFCSIIMPTLDLIASHMLVCPSCPV